MPKTFILIDRADGGVTKAEVLIPDDIKPEDADSYVQAQIDKIKTQYPPSEQLTSWIKIQKEDIPPRNDLYRNAWKRVGTRIEHDMTKAREIHLKMIRAARDGLLNALDVEWSKNAAQKKNAEADAIEAERQRLRDIPQTFDLSGATTVEQLKNLWPAGLPR